MPSFLSLVVIIVTHCFVPRPPKEQLPKLQALVAPAAEGGLAKALVVEAALPGSGFQAMQWMKMTCL